MRRKLRLAAVACIIALVAVLTTDTSQTPFSAIASDNIVSFSINGEELIYCKEDTDKADKLVEILRNLTVYNRHDAEGEAVCSACLNMSGGETIEINVYEKQISINGWSYTADKSYCRNLAAKLDGVINA